MSDVLISLLPPIIGATAAPALIMIVLVLLTSEGGVAKTTAFAAGAMLVRLVQGILFGFVFEASEEVYAEAGPNPVVTGVLMLAGVLLLVNAYREWSEEVDPDAPPPKWLESVSGISAVKAFGAGGLLILLMAKQWIFTLSAIGVITDADLGPQASRLWYLFYVVAAQSLTLAALVIRVVAPVQAASILQRARGWLERNNRTVTITVSLVFGLFFLWKGLSALL